jgi:hypothetical protein
VAVDDRVTQRFMQLFYAEPRAGPDTRGCAPRVALRQETDPRGLARAPGVLGSVVRATPSQAPGSSLRRGNDAP